MNIVIPVMSLHRGGGCRVIAEMANGLQAYGHRVSIVLLQNAELAYDVRVPIIRVPALIPEVLPEADVYIPNFYPTVMPAYQAGKARVVRLSNGYEPLWVPDKGAALETYRLPVPVLAISRVLQQQIRQAVGRSSYLVQPGVDPSVFRPYPEIPRRRHRVFFIYRAESHGYFYKGSADFFQAMDIVRRVIPDVEIVMVSTDGVEIQTDLPFTLARADTDRDMAELYAGSDLFVSASWFEALCLPALEAMACGTPVVTTDSGGVRDFAVPGENCLMVPPRSPELLARAILRVLSNDFLRERLRRAGLRTAAQWTWQRFYRQVDAALTTALAAS
ncbi:glycosyltransferase family 4 protein [Kyrpidia tusciae]|uniref:Glycosyl transferase group 1 n=1 Tax=Kyrpidia tusciae (strain DSM 2912 / NBRC 15312 / T2) TaxID=562970 RepID=D5WXK0_KYRT2|nr:glycosyltransferase family 4 protein [Kyrpidia tusciae]ADG05921.1 glycosyl transferase group 1 [Kyrpidia tusciae DSM 2912]